MMLENVLVKTWIVSGFKTLIRKYSTAVRKESKHIVLVIIRMHNYEYDIYIYHFRMKLDMLHNTLCIASL